MWYEDANGCVIKNKFSSSLIQSRTIARRFNGVRVKEQCLWMRLNTLALICPIHLWGGNFRQTDNGTNGEFMWIGGKMRLSVVWARENYQCFQWMELKNNILLYWRQQRAWRNKGYCCAFFNINRTKQMSSQPTRLWVEKEGRCDKPCQRLQAGQERHEG